MGQETAPVTTSQVQVEGSGEQERGSGSPLVIPVSTAKSGDIIAADGSLIVEEVEGEQVRQIKGDNLEQVAQIDLNVGVENVQVEDHAGGTGPDWDMVDSPLSEDNDFDVNMSFLGEEEIDLTIHSVSQSILSDVPPPPPVNTPTPLPEQTTTLESPSAPEIQHSEPLAITHPTEGITRVLPVSTITKITNPSSGLSSSSSTEVQGLFDKVADLERSLQASSQVISDFKSIISNNLKSEMNIFAGNEKIVFEKLDELVMATYRNSESIQVAVQGIKGDVVRSVQTAIQTEVAQPLASLTGDVQNLTTRISSLESRPTLEKNSVVSTLNDEVVRKFRGNIC